MRVNDRVTTPKGPGKITSLQASKQINNVTWAYVLLDNGTMELYDTVKLQPEQQEEEAQ